MKLFEFYDSDENGAIDLNEFINQIAGKRKNWFRDNYRSGGQGGGHNRGGRGGRN